MKVERNPWGKAELITIYDEKADYLVKISNFGGTIVDIEIPDKFGKRDSIVVHQNSMEDYLKYGGYLGASVGRVANRIANGTFHLKGKKYELAKNNNGIHCLHGGTLGFSHKIWNIQDIKEDPINNVVIITLSLFSPNEDENFPGNLSVTLVYKISPMQISWEFRAITDKTTIINLTNHTYWNLEGLDSLIDSQILQLKVDRFNENDESCLPTGKILKVQDTGVDFRNGMTLKETFQRFGDVDNNFFLEDYDSKNSYQDLLEIGELKSIKSGRVMKIATSEPCVQVYTGNFMEKIQISGNPCKKHGAICLETQKVPNAINFPEFADSVILHPNQKYIHTTVHTFSIEK